MDWCSATDKYHVLTFAHDCKLSSLPAEWQRELAALWRLQTDVFNGAYLQFLHNWGKESYLYASQALKKIGAHRTAEIVDLCQALVEEHFDCEAGSYADLIPNPVINPDGTVTEPGSVLPDNVINRIYELSYEFMAYPDDLPQLGMSYYGAHIDRDNRS